MFELLENGEQLGVHESSGERKNENIHTCNDDNNDNIIGDFLSQIMSMVVANHTHPGAIRKNLIKN